MSELQTLILDYGADSVDAKDAACEICERGMRFHSPWRFSFGSVLRLAFTLEDGRIEAEACVVDCTPASAREYQTTLLFVEPPPALRASLGKFSVSKPRFRQ